MNSVSKAQYAEMVKTASEKSPAGKNILFAFITGGLICTLGQGLQNFYEWLGWQKDAPLLVSVTLIFLSALLTALGCYDKIARFAGAGTLVPITGFANAVASPAIEFRSEGLVPGMSAKLFSIAGPVIVYGLTASWIYGILLMLYRSTGTQ